MTPFLAATAAPWPWYLAGVAIGLVVPMLLVIGGRSFSISSNLRHLCAASGSALPLFRYDWKREGGWNLVFMAGLIAGGALASVLWGPSEVAASLSPATLAYLRGTGLGDLSGVAPPALISWTALGTLPGLLAMVVGGFLVGFGARWAGGCTSGHAISGLAAGEFPSLLAVLGFFAGGLCVTYLVWPWLL